MGEIAQLLSTVDERDNWPGFDSLSESAGEQLHQAHAALHLIGWQQAEQAALMATVNSLLIVLPTAGTLARAAADGSLNDPEVCKDVGKSEAASEGKADGKSGGSSGGKAADGDTSSSSTTTVAYETTSTRPSLLAHPLFPSESLLKKLAAAGLDVVVALPDDSVR